MVRYRQPRLPNDFSEELPPAMEDLQHGELPGQGRLRETDGASDGESEVKGTILRLHGFFDSAEIRDIIEAASERAVSLTSLVRGAVLADLTR